MVVDLCNLIKGLEGQWVAFDEDYTQVISHSLDLEKVVAEAKEKGFDDPILFRVPEGYIA